MNKRILRQVVIIILFSNIFVSSQIFAQAPFLKVAKTPTIVADTSTQKIKINDLNKEIEITDNIILKADYSTELNEKQTSLVNDINKFDKYINDRGNDFNILSENNLSHFLLLNAKFNWKEYYNQLKKYQNSIQETINEITENQLGYIANKKKWQLSLPELKNDIPENIKNHINSNLEKTDEIINIYDSKIKILLNTENEVEKDITLIENTLNNIDYLTAKQRDAIFTKNKDYIFNVKYSLNTSNSIANSFAMTTNENLKTFSYFYSSIKSDFTIYLISLILFSVFFIFIRKKYKKLNHNDNIPGFKYINNIIVKHPLETLIIYAMAFWTFLISYSPLFINMFLYLAILITILFLLSSFLDIKTKKIIRILIVLLVLHNIESLSWHFGNYSRLYLLFEGIIAVVFTFKYLQPNLIIEKFKQKRIKTLDYLIFIAPFLFLLSSISLISNILGFVDLSIYSLKLGIHASAISVIVIGFIKITESFIYASINVINIYYPELIDKYGRVFLTKSKKILNILMLIVWLKIILKTSEMYSYTMEQIVGVFIYKIEIGSLSFTLGNILMFVIAIYITFIIANFTKTILEREILTKKLKTRGLAASISLTLRICIVFSGTLIALSITDMDLSKIGIIAGALSVGIGFGLQNVVNNFISGLILIYEKPIQEGDTVEVDKLMGRVTNIGIRSSNVLTYDGAEVVVPNSNLISNQLINWTLSNNQRRMEIKIGTAYISDPSKTIELLIRAALANEYTLTDPEPQAYFSNFGESTLDFRLLFWVHFENGMRAKSAVSINVYNLFRENNIEIAFPQVDLNVRKKGNGNLDREE